MVQNKVACFYSSWFSYRRKGMGKEENGTEEKYRKREGRGNSTLIVEWINAPALPSAVPGGFVFQRFLFLFSRQ